MDAGISLELAVCLTTVSIEGFRAMVDYFAAQPGRVLLLPFPVRGEGARDYIPTEKQVYDLADSLRDVSDAGRRVLPPSAYMERLLDFMSHGIRVARCRIPGSIVQTFADGNVASCCMDWSCHLGRINTAEEAAKTVRTMVTHPAYRLYFAEPPRMPACHDCFTVSEILNLYFDGAISDAEMRTMDLYSGAESMRVLQGLRAAFGGTR